MKTAAYICGGCGIAERLDTAQLALIAEREGKMELVRQHPFLCSGEGVETIRADIDKEGVTHLAIAACSRRAKTEAFHFPGAAVTRANLREGVIWVRPDAEEARETTQEMAADYVRMACAEAKKLKVPAGHEETGKAKRILVVGGGVSGMTAALDHAGGRAWVFGNDIDTDVLVRWALRGASTSSGFPRGAWRSRCSVPNRSTTSGCARRWAASASTARRS